ncbi:tetratricopeptide repeat protein [Psychroserpens mesophilus]|uniref:tetratricopeptide repeat protein n=1 Tax=Psychroserpens mesophilus TaxID=325473 RepID=UPI003F499B39
MKYLVTVLFISFCLASYSQEKIPYIDYEIVYAKVSESANEQDYDNVLEQLNTIHKNDSTYCSVLTTKSYYLIAQEKFDDALDITNEGLSSDCDQTSKLFLLMNKGVSYSSQEKYSDALTVYEDALKLFPKNPKLWYNKGIALENLDDIPGAVEAYQNAIIYNPLYRNAHLQLGNICYRQQLMAQALMCFNMSLLSEPDTERAFSLLKYVNDIVSTKNENEPISSLSISPDDGAFESIDLILNNRVALNSNYNIENKIKISIVKQNHALLEQLKTIKANGGFWDNYYIPLYQWIASNDYFDNFTYTINASIKNEDYKKIIEKNTGNIETFVEAYVTKWFGIFNENANSKLTHYYYEGVFQGEGEEKNGVSIGDWTFYNNNGQLSSKGFYNNKGERENEWTWYHDNGAVREIAIYKDGKLNGKNKLYYDDGKPYILANSKNDDYDGEYKYYINKGGLKQKKYYKEGKLDGKYLAFFDVGESLIEFEADYKEDIIVGDFKEYYANGDLYSTIQFENNLRNGKEIQYYWNKQKSLEASYKDDKLDGPYITYHTNGNKKEVGQSVNGFFNGLWQSFYDDGILNSEYTYSNGQLDDLYKTYDRDGKLTSEFQYRKGEIISYKFYDKSGNILSDKRKKGGEFYYEGYHPNGNKAAEGLYDISGGKVGYWKFYTNNGTLSEEGTYENDSPIETHKIYYSTGDVESTHEYNAENSTSYYQYFYKSGQLKSQGWYKNGLRHGEWRYYYIDGALEAINFFHKDDLHGTQQYMSVNGKLNRESTYEYGLPIKDVYFNTDEQAFETVNLSTSDSKFKRITHYQNGNKETETDFVNQLKHGAYTFYNFNGNVGITGSYHNDEMTGEWTWYYDNGNVKSTANYRNGNLHGELKNYFESGQLEDVYSYEFGNQSGKSLSYHENGNLSITTEYLNDQEHLRKEFYSPSGKLQLVRIYNYGTLIGYTYLDSNGNEKEMIPITNETIKIEAFYDNGKPSRTFEYVNGDIQGDYKTYYYNGQLESLTIYDKGEVHDVNTTYFEDGKIRSKTHLTYGDNNGLKERFYPNGKLKESINFLNDERHGEAKFYDESGRLTKTEYYSNGTVYATTN